MAITIKTPYEFNFDECYRFLDRSNVECLHEVRDGKVYKLLLINGNKVLIELQNSKDKIKVNVLNTEVSKAEEKWLKNYIIEWWDIERDLTDFYKFCRKDPMLKVLSKDYFGLRMIGFPELFECLIWAVIGQQINLNFAYTIKKNFVEKYGDCLEFQGQKYYLFPDANVIADLSIEELKEIKFSRQKATYTIGIAKAMVNEEITKSGLSQMSYDDAKTELKKLKGIGDWTADYALMKCLHIPNAIPLGDVGLHNALKARLNLPNKPSAEMLESFRIKWSDWSGYVCFYLWRSLLAD